MIMATEISLSSHCYFSRLKSVRKIMNFDEKLRKITKR